MIFIDLVSIEKIKKGGETILNVTKEGTFKFIRMIYGRVKYRQLYTLTHGYVMIVRYESHGDFSRIAL